MDLLLNVDLFMIQSVESPPAILRGSGFQTQWSWTNGTKGEKGADREKGTDREKGADREKGTDREKGSNLQLFRKVLAWDALA